MRDRDKADANDRRDEIFAAVQWRCVICGAELRSGIPELAHRVIKSKSNLRTYGRKIIHHPMNLVPVEKKSCNSKAILNFQPAELLLIQIFDVVTGVEPEPNLVEHYEQLRKEFEERRTK